ncbi:Protein of unknown function, partial [Cotesia congregata]
MAGLKSRGLRVDFKSIIGRRLPEDKEINYSVPLPLSPLLNTGRQSPASLSFNLDFNLFIFYYKGKYFEAYRKWVCSSLVPYFAHEGPAGSSSSDHKIETRVRPCRSFCQSVEQRCPYLLPGDRAPAYPTQYAGEPTFLCRDPNIPETGEQATRALHGNEEEECCFRVCSEEHPGLGVCANCTDRKPRGRRFLGDPPTAPHCETSPPIQSTGQANSLETSSMAPPSTMSASSCSGGSISIVQPSSSGGPSSSGASVSLVYLLCIWAVVVSLTTGQTLFPWSPAATTAATAKLVLLHRNYVPRRPTVISRTEHQQKLSPSVYPLTLHLSNHKNNIINIIANNNAIGDRNSNITLNININTMIIININIIIKINRHKCLTLASLQMPAQCKLKLLLFLFIYYRNWYSSFSHVSWWWSSRRSWLNTWLNLLQ